MWALHSATTAASAAAPGEQLRVDADAAGAAERLQRSPSYACTAPKPWLSVDLWFRIFDFLDMMSLLSLLDVSPHFQLNVLNYLSRLDTVDLSRIPPSFVDDRLLGRVACVMGSSLRSLNLSGLCAAPSGGAESGRSMRPHCSRVPASNARIRCHADNR